MHNRLRSFATLLTGALLATTAVRTQDAPERQPKLSAGSHCLFIGHSFFVPVAKAFERLAAKHPSHEVETVFAAGAAGSPGALWNSPRRRRQVEAKLATGKIELLGMTAFGMAGSTVDHYQRWMDLALKHNEKTRFFIGQSWTLGGPRMDTRRYATNIRAMGEQLLETIAELQEIYPDNKIHYVNYGLVAAEMKSRFDAEQLPGIDRMIGRGDSAMFRDRLIGHAGPMMLDLSALCWMHTLYGVELDRLPYGQRDSEIVRKIIADSIGGQRVIR